MAPRAKLKLSGVTTRQQVSEDIDAVSWCILSNEDAAEILKDTEEQVLETLVIIFGYLLFLIKRVKFQTQSIVLIPFFIFIFDI